MRIAPYKNETTNCGLKFNYKNNGKISKEDFSKLPTQLKEANPIANRAIYSCNNVNHTLYYIQSSVMESEYYVIEFENQDDRPLPKLNEANIVKAINYLIDKIILK